MSLRLPRQIPANFNLTPQRMFRLNEAFNFFQVSLPFAAGFCIMTNTTSNPFYLTIGSRRVPTVADTQWVCPAAAGGIPGSLQIPVGLVTEFAGFVPTTPAFDDPDTLVNVLFQG